MGTLAHDMYTLAPTVEYNSEREERKGWSQTPSWISTMCQELL